jgi:ketosteroid isomerase-like protein
MNTTWKTLAAAAIAGGSLSTVAWTQDAASGPAQAFASARLEAFGKGDVQTLLNQMNDDATIFSSQGVLHGKAQIEPMLQAVIAEFSQPGAKFEMISQVAVGSTVAFVWRAETAKNVYRLGVETYVLDGNKAAYETLVIDATPKP